MPGLILNAQGTKRIFRPDGIVVTAAADGTETAVGEWSSGPRRDANRIHYIEGGAEHEFDVKYAFNGDNQLVATIPATANGGADSAPFTFAGQIRIDDNQDVAYQLLDEKGELTGETILVHAALSFASVDKLTVALAGGGTTQIFGDQAGASNLESAPNTNTASPGLDLIQFSATTVNTVNGSKQPADAIILFTGHWGVNDKGLVFNAGLAAGQLKIQFGGTYKGVTAGLAYYAKNGDKEIAFTIHGEHRFKRPTGGSGSANWLLSLGHSGHKIEAVAKLKVEAQSATGNKLTLAGDLQLIGKPGQPAPKEVQISLKATYELKEKGQLVFAADFKQNGDRPSYKLGFEGRYDVRNGGQVTFLVQLEKTPTGNDLKVSLGSVWQDQRLHTHLNAVIQRSTSGTIDFNIDFSIRMRWVNGELVPFGQPQLAAAKPV